MKYFISYVIIIFLVFSACTTTPEKRDEDLKITDEQNTVHLVDLIQKYNSGSVQSYILKFNVEGHSGAQKFKAEGNAEYNNNPKRIRLVFHDAILQSRITEIVQEDDLLKFYFPLDKTLYIENSNKIDLKPYTNFDLDYNLVSDLLTGKIPLIKNYSVYKGLESETDPATKENKLIIFENSDSFETVSFIKDVPDKILWVNKNTKEKIETYLRKPVLKDNFLFYKEIKIISPGADLNLLIRFSSIKFNTPVDTEKMTNLKLPGNVKVIKRY